jgi:Eukaryotic-type carbonic anhydrase
MGTQVIRRRLLRHSSIGITHQLRAFFVSWCTALIRLPKDYPQNRIPSVKDGGLPNQYNFAQLHFHWGSDGSRGSEHTIKQKQSVVSPVALLLCFSCNGGICTGSPLSCISSITTRSTGRWRMPPSIRMDWPSWASSYRYQLVQRDCDT